MGAALGKGLGRNKVFLLRDSVFSQWLVENVRLSCYGLSKERGETAETLLLDICVPRRRWCGRTRASCALRSLWAAVAGAGGQRGSIFNTSLVLINLSLFNREL